MRPRLSRGRKALVALGLFLLFALPFCFYIGVFGGNVRVVEKGRFYRSAQLSGSNLENVLKADAIRSVVNLRGPSKHEFYRSEIAVCRSLDVRHFDLSLSAYRLPKPQELKDVLKTLDVAPRPVLVHCQQGADRSGLVSTIYQTVYEGVPLDRAEGDQLTWRYGHFPLVGTWRMDRFFDLYRQNANGESLRSFIERDYPAVYAREKGSVK